MSNSSSPQERPLQTRLVTGIFLLALVFNLWGVSVGWKFASLWGYEFRQTQTAISALFIQREHNFSLAYPTPVLGKPWSIPFEFPLYQWTAVVTSNATGLPLVQAGRLVGVVCFYLGLGALYLILRHLKLSRSQGLVLLSFVLTCPLYIFYSRAFLIETMALMCGLWYLLALLKLMERRRLPWLALVVAAGTGAGLVKVTTFIVLLLPAFGWSLWWLWQARPRAAAPHWAPLARTLGWLAAAHAIPFAATLAWLRYSDYVKVLNPSGAGLTSAKLAAFNFGYGRRFDGYIWQQWWEHITGNIAAPAVLVAASIIILLFARRWRVLIAVCAGLFLATQLIFPVLYGSHGYYYLANAFLLLLAAGLGVLSLWETRRLPRWLPALIWVALLGLQARFYLDHQYQIQRTEGDAGGLATALRKLTEPDESLVIVGDDWSSILPYHTQRRTLMVRSELPNRPEYLKTAFNLMKTERVVALVLMNGERANTGVLSLALTHFNLDPRPVFTWQHGTQSAVVYLDRSLRTDAMAVVARGGFYEVTPLPSEVVEPSPLINREYAYADLLPRYHKLFRIIHPQPVRFFATFGPEIWFEDQPGKERYAANPETKLWFQLPPGKHRVRTDLDIVPGAWQDVPAADASDGVEFVAAALFPDGRREVLQSRYFNPLANPGDRGVQPIDWTVELPAGAELELNVNPGPRGNGARDWSTLGPITVD